MLSRFKLGRISAPKIHRIGDMAPITCRLGDANGSVSVSVYEFIYSYLLVIVNFNWPRGIRLSKPSKVSFFSLGRMSKTASLMSPRLAHVLCSVSFSLHFDLSSMQIVSLFETLRAHLLAWYSE